MQISRTFSPFSRLRRTTHMVIGAYSFASRHHRPRRSYSPRIGRPHNTDRRGVPSLLIFCNLLLTPTSTTLISIIDIEAFRSPWLFIGNDNIDQRVLFVPRDLLASTFLTGFGAVGVSETVTLLLY
jgi:hypothetical protein